MSEQDSPASPVPAYSTAPPSAPAEAPAPSGSSPRPNWSPWTTVGGFLCVIAIIIVVGNLIVLAGADPDSQSTDLILQAVLAVSLIGVPLVMTRSSGGGLAQAAARLGLRRFDLSWAGWGVIALVAFVVFLIPYTVLVQPSEQTTVQTIADQRSTGTLVVFFLLVVIAAPVSEELFFRGFFFGGLRTKLSFWPSALISGLVFGALHIPSGAGQAPALALFGVTLAWLYEQSDSLGPGILAHMLLNWNAFLLTVATN